MKIKVKTPAKINLSLDVLDRRPDGYHNVSMVMQTVSLYDYVTVETTDSEEIEIICDYPGVPCDESNIVYKACERFFDYNKLKRTGLKITIEKNIPTQAGLAGGSADGAGVILALNRLFNTMLKEEELCEIGAKIGADIPFSIVGGTKLATGIGTTLKKLPDMPKCQIVICKPQINISTAEAYKKIDSLKSSHIKYTDEMIKAIYARDLWMVGTTLFNDFEYALDLEPIKAIKKVMFNNKALGGCMSGSGSAVFGVFSSEKKAEKCVNELSKEYKDVFLCTPTKDGCTIID